MASSPPPRWHDRLSNFVRSAALLREALAIEAERPLTELEKAGVVQRFEVAWALGWKLMADFLVDQLAPPAAHTPMASIRAAASAGIIANADDWVAAGKLRNTLAHLYSESKRDDGLAAIRSTHATLFDRFATDMAERRDRD